MTNIVRKNKNVHFVGVGGAGMSGLALILHNLGFQVSGSDKAPSKVTRMLQKQGIAIHKGHSRKNVKGANLVVFSSAIQKSNVELTAANNLHIPIMRRAEMLGEIMRMKFSVAVSGTHGKTTTTSMIGSIFHAAELSPTLIVGGIAREPKTTRLLGKGSCAIVEADEFDRSFLCMFPSVAVVTTLESDHLDCYKDIDDIKDAFVEFCNKVPFYGCVILCIDEDTVQDIMPRIHKATVTYGLLPQADYTARELRFEGYGASFKAYHQNEFIGDFTIRVPGEHNVKNALAAIAVSREMNVPRKAIIKGLADFMGVHRRFEIKGEKKGITVIDDYAHHPTEIHASLMAAKALGRRIVAVFQPHLYSRTRDFYAAFAKSFLLADVMIVTDIYPAREKPIPGISGELIVKAARELGHKRTHYVSSKATLPQFLKRKVKRGDLVITMGAGDIDMVGNRFLRKL